jgi:hypothetical protein
MPLASREPLAYNADRAMLDDWSGPMVAIIGGLGGQEIVVILIIILLKEFRKSVKEISEDVAEDGSEDSSKSS